MKRNIDLYQDTDGVFHYRIFEPGVKSGRRGAPTACGLDTTGMRAAARFPLGDMRGRAHFDRACEGCMEALIVLFDSLT